MVLLSQDYQFEQNIYSDSRFLKDSLERTEVQEKKSTLITDGAYSGKENHDLAAQKNIRLDQYRFIGENRLMIF